MPRTQLLLLAVFSSLERIHSALSRTVPFASLFLICILAICHWLIVVDVPQRAQHAQLKRKVVQSKRAGLTPLTTKWHRPQFLISTRRGSTDQREASSTTHGSTSDLRRRKLAEET